MVFASLEIQVTVKTTVFAPSSVKSLLKQRYLHPRASSHCKTMVLVSVEVQIIIETTAFASLQVQIVVETIVFASLEAQLIVETMVLASLEAHIIVRQLYLRPSKLP